MEKLILLKFSLDLKKIIIFFVCYILGKLLLAQSYLATGEPHKAYNLVTFENQQIPFYLKAISLFELHSYPDYVIAMVGSILDMHNLSPSDIVSIVNLD